MSVLGDDDEEIGEELYGAQVGAGLARRMLAGRRGAQVRLPKRPQWRAEIAPGVGVPGIGLEPLPLTPNRADGVFDATVSDIFFEARPQRPFRAERLIATIRRSTGAAGIAVRSTAILIGTQVGQVELGAIDLDNFAATAFDTRLNLPQATPGMLIRIPVQVFPTVPVGETVVVGLIFLGRTVR